MKLKLKFEDKNHNNNNRICAISDYRELNRVRDFVLRNARQFGFGEKDAYNIALAVDEACANLIRYAFKFDKQRQFCVMVETVENEFVVNIFDDGKPFNPVDVELPEMESYLKTYHRGRLGIIIMRKVMDEISYTPSNDSKSYNILKLKKVLH
jgi:serine/threonine-protein kinase RsbW